MFEDASIRLLPLIYVASSPGSVKRKTSPAAAISPKVKVVHKQIINESHPVVQQLVEEYEYDLEASIDAVRLCGGTLERAMDYLARRDTENGEELLTDVEPALDMGLVGEPTEERYICIHRVPI